MKKPADFREAFIKTNSHEGGYVNNPVDRGGETFAGISWRYWGNWEGWFIIEKHKQNCTPEELPYVLENDKELNALVEEFYQINFWDENSLMMFPQQVAEELYDTGVNQGVVVAARYLQRSLNLLNRNERDYKNLKIDGYIGVKTVRAFEAYMATSKRKYRSRELCIKWLLKLLNYFQMAKYVAISEADGSQEIFMPGWLNRI